MNYLIKRIVDSENFVALAELVLGLISLFAVFGLLTLLYRLLFWYFIGTQGGGL